jgi:NADH:ubiquinone reductase (H+-translocating)
MTQILILGGGFAGLWSAVGAARKRAELGRGGDAIEITLVDRNPYHAIRVRNYECDLSGVTIPFADVLDPIGVAHLAAGATGLDPTRRQVDVATRDGARQLSYDRLVLALGSELNRPRIPGLAEHGFDIDTYAAACRLDAHLRALAQRPRSPARDTVLVVGAGLTGIELATELPKKLAQLFGPGRGHVILADSNAHIGSNMGEHALPVIDEALAALGIETRVNVAVASVDATGALLASGERIATETVVWCAGMRANPLVAGIPGKHDRFGRLAVDEYMRVEGVPGMFAAGDCAWSLIDGTRATVMSCQHGRPMGRFAGHNVVADLVGAPMLPLRIDWYTTILDLGAWGALYTEGWDRDVVSRGAPAKETKRIINCQRIYPPLTRDRDAILAAGAPVVSSPPQRFTDKAAPAAPSAAAAAISAE